MSFLKKLLFKKDQKRKKKDEDRRCVPVSTENALSELQGAQDLLAKKSDYLECKIAEQLKIAKANGTKNKRVALQALKRKARYEKTLQHIDKTLTSIEGQRDALESSKVNREVVGVLGYSSSALQGMQTKMSIDHVDDILDGVREELDTANEISLALSSPSSSHLYDDDELLRELAELENESVASPRTSHTPQTQRNKENLERSEFTERQQSRSKRGEVPAGRLARPAAV